MSDAACKHGQVTASFCTGCGVEMVACPCPKRDSGGWHPAPKCPSLPEPPP